MSWSPWLTPAERGLASQILEDRELQPLMALIAMQWKKTWREIAERGACDSQPPPRPVPGFADLRPLCQTCGWLDPDSVYGCMSRAGNYPERACRWCAFKDPSIFKECVDWRDPEDPDFIPTVRRARDDSTHWPLTIAARRDPKSFVALWATFARAEVNERDQRGDTR